ncbi:MAG TPA: hypothetical protein VJ964_07740 [Balneolaceae bacterium]|nr:hypothetical protein [Balneolaceae bacterium]
MSRLHVYKPTLVYIFVALLFTLVIYGCDSTGSNDNNSGSKPVNGSLFDSGNISANGSFSYTFSQDTTIAYFCRIHAPDMKGSVIVQTGATITGEDTVIMTGMQFSPSQITVAPSTKVVWVNHDSFVHTVTNGSPSSNSNNGNGGGY